MLLEFEFDGLDSLGIMLFLGDFIIILGVGEVGGLFSLGEFVDDFELGLLGNFLGVGDVLIVDGKVLLGIKGLCFLLLWFFVGMFVFFVLCF